MPRIVVGVDGSANSQRALEWAISEAELRNADLVVLHAWHEPAAILGSPYAVGLYAPKAFQDAAAQTLEESLAAVDVTALSGRLTTQLIEAPPAQALVDAATDATLVVVGSRGHGGFTGLLLGSVSQHLAHHARCPVVIVPPTDEPG